LLYVQTNEQIHLCSDMKSIRENIINTEEKIPSFDIADEHLLVLSENELIMLFPKYIGIFI